MPTILLNVYRGDREEGRVLVQVSEIPRIYPISGGKLVLSRAQIIRTHPSVDWIVGRKLVLNKRGITDPGCFQDGDKQRYTAFRAWDSQEFKG